MTDGAAIPVSGADRPTFGLGVVLEGIPARIENHSRAWFES
jgi:hypothetical protein